MCTSALVLLSLLAQVAPPAVDPQGKAQAQRLLTEGSTLYEKGDYAGALEKFTAAYSAYPSPKLMFNIGQADRDLSRPVEALEAFEKFLASDTNASPETTADARRAVAELQEQLGRIRVDCETSGAEVSLDGKSVGLTPLPDLIWATPGRHQITASHESMTPALENVDVTAGSVGTVTPRLLPLASPVAAAPVPEPVPEPVAAPVPQELELQVSPAPSPARQGWWLGRKWTWLAAGSTVLLAVGAVAAGVAMQSRFDSLEKSCGSLSGKTSGCSQSEIDSVSWRGTTANVLWGLAAAGAVTTGVLFYVEGRAVTVSPLAGATTGFLAAVRY
ncbi:MAG: PEGA domain-containing protein [Polyangia bacterium]